MSDIITKRKANACLVCGEELKYLEKAESMVCGICHIEYTSNAKCESGHYICDECHSKKGIETIVDICLKNLQIQ